MQPGAGTDLVCIWNVLPSRSVIYDLRKKQSGPLVCMISRCLIMEENGLACPDHRAIKLGKSAVLGSLTDFLQRLTNQHFKIS